MNHIQTHLFVCAVHESNIPLDEVDMLHVQVMKCFRGSVLSTARFDFPPLLVLDLALNTPLKTMRVKFSDIPASIPNCNEKYSASPFKRHSQ